MHCASRVEGNDRVKDPDTPEKKKPCFIRLKALAPMCLAALAEVHTGLVHHEGDGFVIITAASDQGIVDGRWCSQPSMRESDRETT